MTDRERWTVYPLLFLTMGIAMRDKLEAPDVVPDARFRNVFCDALVVTDQQRKRQVVVSSDPEGGFVQTYGNKNGLQVILGNTERLGGLMFVDPGGGTHINPGSVYAARVETPPQTDESGAQPPDAPEKEPAESTPTEPAGDEP